MPTDTATKARSEFIQGLRELADFIEQDGSVPLPHEIDATCYGITPEAFLGLSLDRRYVAGRFGADLFQLKREFSCNVAYRIVIGVEQILPNPPLTNVEDILAQARTRIAPTEQGETA